MNRNKIQFIHIPKTGGTFVLNCLFSTNNLMAEHRKIEKNSKIILGCIRNPYSFYESFFNFFYKPNHKIGNKFQYITKKYDSIDIFINDLLNNKKQFFNQNKDNLIVNYDTYYFNINNNYGLLTNYLLFFYNYNGIQDNKSIESFLKNLSKNITFLKTENLRDDLINFCNKYNIEYNRKYIDTYINNFILFIRRY